MLCSVNVPPIFMDNVLRMVLSLTIILCCICLKKIIVEKKQWDLMFWLCIVANLILFSLYGFISHHIFLANTFSYDGFVAVLSFLTVAGILFSKEKHVRFADGFGSKNTAIFFATFIVFSIIYVSTVNYDFHCVSTYWNMSVDLLKLVIYPLTLIFAVSAFLFRLTVCVDALIVYVILFEIKSIVAVWHGIMFAETTTILVIDIVSSVITMIVCIVCVSILFRIKLSRKRKCSNI